MSAQPTTRSPFDSRILDSLIIVAVVGGNVRWSRVRRKNGS